MKLMFFKIAHAFESKCIVEIYMKCIVQNYCSIFLNIEHSITLTSKVLRSLLSKSHNWLQESGIITAKQDFF